MQNELRDILENLSTDFDDFTEDLQKLVGKQVLHETGQSFSDKRNRRIVQITKVTKTGFRIYESNGLFSLIDGHLKGLNSKQDMSVVSFCYLLTTEEADKIVALWNKNKQKRIIIDIITQNVNKLELESLIKIRDIINNELKLI